VTRALLELGAELKVHDPEAIPNARKLLGDRVTYCSHNYDALQGSDALVIITEWNLYRNPDFARIRSLLNYPVIFDGRNQYNPSELKRLGFLYFAVGRPQPNQVEV
jgi:UDPglucose 6-dehydrogenase